MFKVNRKEATTELSEKIKSNPNISIEEILLHKDFATSVRYEIKIMLDYLFEKDHLNTILDYALFGKQPPNTEVNNVQLRQLRFRQLNNNAVGLFEANSRRITEYYKAKESNEIILKRLNDFMNNEKLLGDRFFAGHFQRIVENLIRCEAIPIDGDKKWEHFDKMVDILIDNSHILAYQQLLSKFLCDFTDSLESHLTSIVKEMYLAAACNVCNFQELDSNQKGNENLEIDFTVSGKFKDTLKNVCKNNDLKPEHQPFNIKDKQIELYVCNSEACTAYDTPDREKIFNAQKNILLGNYLHKYGNHKDNYDIRAYLLLMATRTAMNDRPDLYSQLFRNEPNSILISCLFFCGVFCSEFSAISFEAFKILDVIFNGSEIFDIEPLPETDEYKDYFLIKEYFAEAFQFDKDQLSYQMVNAFPLFWNHYYGVDNYQMTEDEKNPFNLDTYFNGVKGAPPPGQCKYQRPKGESALEILLPCYITEPPLSTQLVYNVIQVLMGLSKKRTVLFEKNTLESRKKAADIDAIFFEFLRHKFDFPLGESCHKKCISDLLNDLIPLPSTDVKSISRDIPTRPPLNGFIIDITLRYLTYIDPETEYLIPEDEYFNFFTNGKDPNSGHYIMSAKNAFIKSPSFTPFSTQMTNVMEYDRKIGFSILATTLNPNTIGNKIRFVDELDPVQQDSAAGSDPRLQRILELYSKRNKDLLKKKRTKRHRKGDFKSSEQRKSHSHSSSRPSSKVHEEQV